jgi:hypothetical protein
MRHYSSYFTTARMLPVSAQYPEWQIKCTSQVKQQQVKNGYRMAVQLQAICERDSFQLITEFVSGA